MGLGFVVPPEKSIIPIFLPLQNQILPCPSSFMYRTSVFPMMGCRKFEGMKRLLGASNSYAPVLVPKTTLFFILKT